MRKLVLATAAALTLSSAAFAQPIPDPAQSPSGTYGLDKGHASVTWRVDHLGLSNYTARFADIEASLDWNSEDPTASTVSVTIDPMSVRTDYYLAEEKDWDNVLSTDARWFNAGEHPEISFVSTGATIGEGNTGTVTGDLTLLGVTQPITLDVTFNGGLLNRFAQKWAMGFSGTTTINRSEFGMGALVPNIGDEVEILIEAEFIKAD